MKAAIAASVFAVLIVFVTPIRAHFKLLAPASWIVEDERGDPQKLGPCGGTFADAGTPSGLITDVQGGQMLRIAVAETVYHPGHYRIALARTRDALPADPQVTMHDTERGPRSLSATIDTDPEPPVLIDGLWPHSERGEYSWETEIEIPNVECATCVLQVIQFMAEHPGVREGGFSYHHCADLRISADPNLPVDARW